MAKYVLFPIIKGNLCESFLHEKEYYNGFFALIAEDIIYSPIESERPHFSSYSRETGFVIILISIKPAAFIIFSKSSTEEAPDTQQECIASSFCISGVSSFMITMSQMEMRPPGFSARRISR